MARYNNGINGSFHGKIGSAIGCTWKGVDYIRGLPTRSKKPPTEKQLLNRAKFAFMHKWVDPLTEIITMGFSNYSPRMTARMAAHSYNYHHALRGEHPNFEIDYASVLVSHGPLQGARDIKIWYEEGKVKVTWDPQSEGDPSDNMILTVYLTERGLVDCVKGHACRESGYCEYAIDEEHKGERAEVYVSFKSLMDNRFSNSQYAGRIN